LFWCIRRGWFGLEVCGEEVFGAGVGEEVEFAEVGFKEAQAGDFGDGEVFVQVAVDGAEVGFGGGFFEHGDGGGVVGEGLGRGWEKFVDCSDLDPGVGADGAGVSGEPEEDRAVEEACVGVDVEAQGGWARAEFVVEHEGGVVEHHAGTEEFDAEGALGFFEAGLKGGEEAGWVFFGEVEEHEEVLSFKLGGVVSWVGGVVAEL